MAKQTINTLKNWFRTGLKPTQAQFWDMFDSFFHKDDKIPIMSVDGLQDEFDKYREKTAPIAIADVDGLAAALEVAGVPGADGKSAYELAVVNGFVGTEAEWLASLQGANGINGVDGKSAYEIAVTNGFVGTEVEWLASLQGTNGEPGAPGTSVPVNFTFFKTSLNGVVPLIAWKWITNLTVSQVILNYADDISVKIGATTYNKATLIGVALPAGTAMTDLDMTITTGYDSGQVTIIFTQA